MIQKLRGQKGFTLIELMIVIAIIGILAAIAIPNFIAYRDKAYCSYAEGDAQNLLAAISCYFSEPDHTELGDWPNQTGSVNFDSICKVTLNGSNIASVTEDTNNSMFTVAVQDGSSRCPRSSQTTKIYTTYMGTSTQGAWN